MIFHKAGRRTPEEQAEDPDKRATSCDEAIAVLRAFADDGGLPSKVSIFGGDDRPQGGGIAARDGGRGARGGRG